MKLGTFYPTAAHAAAAETITAHFAAMPEVEAVLLVNSCARGQERPDGLVTPIATADSCLDIKVLTSAAGPEEAQGPWWTDWKTYYRREAVFRQLEAAGAFSVVHLDFCDGTFVPEPRDGDEAMGPDMFEVAIGNGVAYSVPLWERGDTFQRLRARWLPYYDEDLARRRLAFVRAHCQHNLDHIPLYAARGLYFQCFNRLYDATQMFLQAVFIAHRTYPIAYNKWIQQQVVGILGLPDLYRELLTLLQIAQLHDADLLVAKANAVRHLLDIYVSA